MKLVELACHPESNRERVTKLEAGASVGQKVLRLTFHLEGELGALRVPPERGFVRGKELWKHTCFEAFVRAKGEAGYFEFNFSPSREWDAHRFTAYREGGVIAEEPVTQISVSRAGNVLWLDAMLMLDRLPVALSRPFQLGLSAVIEGRNGAISYWALKHAPGRADFHHADAFAMEL